MVGWWDGDRYLTIIQISPLLGIVLIPLWDRFIIDRNYSKHLLRLYLELFFWGLFTPSQKVFGALGLGLWFLSKFQIPL